MSQRHELLVFAANSAVPVAEICRRFEVSRKTFYKWRERFAQYGKSGLADASTRPLSSPLITSPHVEKLILDLRGRQPTWGPRKLAAWLRIRGHVPLPALSTIAAILKRHGLIDPREFQKHVSFTRFERSAPNQLLQMDYKGPFKMRDSLRCHPLTVLDDHSRFNLVLHACADEKGETVQRVLSAAFERYGLPDEMLMDNGSPWGDDADSPYTKFNVWLLRLGIAVTHGRPYHPQTQGKDERFHRTLKADLLQQPFDNLSCCQPKFDAYRDVYNFERPHEALGMAVPASRYTPSLRAFPAVLPEIEYAPGDIVRKVQDLGRFNFLNRHFWVSKAFKGQPIALRPTIVDGRWEVYFCRFRIGYLMPDAGPRVRRKLDDADITG